MCGLEEVELVVSDNYIIAWLDDVEIEFDVLKSFAIVSVNKYRCSHGGVNRGINIF